VPRFVASLSLSLVVDVVCRSLKNRFSCTKRERARASERPINGPMRASELLDAVKKTFYLTRFVCVRVRLHLCVCELLETTLYDKNYKVFAVVVVGPPGQSPPSETTLQMRSSHDYTTVCVCVCVWSRSSATKMTA